MVSAQMGGMEMVLQRHFWLVGWSWHLPTRSGGPFQWTWYLANDFQFFLITPPLILLYIYVTKRGVTQTPTTA